MGSEGMDLERILYDQIDINFQIYRCTYRVCVCVCYLSVHNCLTIPLVSSSVTSYVVRLSLNEPGLNISARLSGPQVPRINSPCPL